MRPEQQCNVMMVAPMGDVRVMPQSYLVSPRIDNDTPSLPAITVVAAGVRFKAFAIFVTPIFAFAMLFIWRLSLAVQARRDTFLAFAILFSESFYGESGFVSRE
jgi:hypothetical protein